MNDNPRRERLARVLYNKAMQSHYTRASFATLDKHRSMERFDRSAAIRLLRSNNVRDAARYFARETSTSVATLFDNETLDRAAEMLLDEWDETRTASEKE